MALVLPQWLATTNAFIEDTCVIFAVTYLLSRGKTLESLVPVGWRRSLTFGALLGSVAASEVVFPGMRAPYVSHTLVVCFASVLGGWLMAVPVIAIVTLCSLLINPLTMALDNVIVLTVVAAASIASDRLISHSRQPLAIGVVGAASQALAVLLCDVALPAARLPHPTFLSVASIPANAFGLFLAMLVVRDSDTRTRSESNRLAVERFRVLLVSADLAALRARIRPHFLFNTLTAIASLCSSNARQAESSILKLGRLLRRTLEVETTAPTSLSQELEYVKAYIDIQLLRFGDEISASLAFDPGVMDTELPAFSLQTIVENAFQHGLASRSGSGRICVSGRASGAYVTLAVSDDGVGIEPDLRRRLVEADDVPKHGLGIIDKQLRLLYGPRSRLRLFSTPGEGTLVAFRVPRGRSLEARKTL